METIEEVLGEKTIDENEKPKQSTKRDRSKRRLNDMSILEKEKVQQKTEESKLTKNDKAKKSTRRIRSKR